MNNVEMTPTGYEAQDKDVTVNCWQEGSDKVLGFVTVMDKSTRTAFAFKRREPLADALDRTRARIAAGQRKIARQMTKHHAEWIVGGSGTTIAAHTKGNDL